METVVKWLVGIDWARSAHQICLLTLAGEIVREFSIAHSGAGLAELCDRLLAETGGKAEEIAIAIEVSHGPIVETLLERGFLVYVINPKQLDRFRDRFTAAGAKDDRRDARVAADALRTDRHRLRQLGPSSAAVVELREWSRMAEELEEEQTRLGNRIQDQLWRYYPQALRLTRDVTQEWFLSVWALAPTPAKARSLGEKSVAAILKEHRVRRLNASEVIRILREKPVTVAPGAKEAATAHLRRLIARLKLVNRQIREVERELDIFCEKVGGSAEPAQRQSAGQCDVAILRSFPGIGRKNCATLLAEGDDPLRRRDYHAFRPLCGIAPVTKQSGRKKSVTMRYAVSTRLRNAVYHWARTAMEYDEGSRQRYAALRARGHSHARALRSLGDHLGRVLFAMLRNRTLFDPERHKIKPAEPIALPA